MKTNDATYYWEFYNENQAILAKDELDRCIRIKFIDNHWFHFTTRFFEVKLYNGETKIVGRKNLGDNSW